MKLFTELFAKIIIWLFWAYVLGVFLSPITAVTYWLAFGGTINVLHGLYINLFAATLFIFATLKIQIS